MIAIYKSIKFYFKYKQDTNVVFFAKWFYFYFMIACANTNWPLNFIYY